MWCAVLINDVFHDLYDLANICTTWQARSAALKFKVERDYGMCSGADGVF